jgi:hypothetical protein
MKALMIALGLILVCSMNASVCQVHSHGTLCPSPIHKYTGSYANQLLPPYPDITIKYLPYHPEETNSVPASKSLHPKFPHQNAEKVKTKGNKQILN